MQGFLLIIFPIERKWGEERFYETGAVHAESIFLMELKECSKRIYGIPQFVFYALGYAIERNLSMSRKRINGFFLQKNKLQQLNLFEYFKIEDYGAFAF